MPFITEKQSVWKTYGRKRQVSEPTSHLGGQSVPIAACSLWLNEPVRARPQKELPKGEIRGNDPQNSTRTITFATKSWVVEYEMHLEALGRAARDEAIDYVTRCEQEKLKSDH